MDRVIKSYLDKFVQEHSLESLDEAEQFERFVNFVLVHQHFPEHFDLESISTSSAEPGIDGVAVLVNNVLVTTAEDAASVFSSLGRRRAAPVNYLFVQSKRSASFDLGDMLKLPTGVMGLLEGTNKPQDEILQEFLEIHEIVVKNLSSVESGRPICELFYVTTGAWNKNSGLKERALAPGEAQLARSGLFNSVSYGPIDKERLVSLWMKTREPLQATFTVKGYIPLPKINNVVEAYLAITPALDFVNNVLSDPEGRLKSNVFEQNVRSFLGDENPVNARMKAALESPAQHDQFAINNNGVTIISPDVKVQSDRISVSEYQIVNGCQTSHSLFRNKAHLTDQVYLPVKVIEANAEDVISQVIESTNSQTHVDETQFLSTRPFARRVENYFATYESGDIERERRLYFERRTNQYAEDEIGKARVFDISKLARCVAAMFLDIPHIAYMYPTSVLIERKNTFFQSGHHERAYYVAALALYRLELALGNNYVPRSYQSYKWHMLMLLKYLVAGPNTPLLSHSKIDAYCDSIESALDKGGRASAPPFLEAVRIIDRVGTTSRDRRKGQPYTDQLKDSAIRSYKAKAAAAKRTSGGP